MPWWNITCDDFWGCSTKNRIENLEIFHWQVQILNFNFYDNVTIIILSFISICISLHSMETRWYLNLQLIIFVALNFNFVCIAVVNHGLNCKLSESDFELIQMVTCGRSVRSLKVLKFGRVRQGTIDKNLENFENFWK